MFQFIKYEIQQDHDAKENLYSAGGDHCWIRNLEGNEWSSTYFKRDFLFCAIVAPLPM